MKNLNGRLLVACGILSVLIAGCGKEPAPSTPDKTDPGQPDTPTEEIKPLVLSANPPTVILEEKDNAEEAVTFSWEDGNEYESPAVYTLILNAGGNETDTHIIDGIREKKKALTVKELNDILISRWKKEPGKKVIVEARVSSVSGEKTIAESEKEYIDATPYGEKAELTAMALYGTATGEQQLTMKRDEENPSLFTYEGMFVPGGLKVLCNPDGTLDTDWFIASEDDKEIRLNVPENMTLVAKGEGRNDYNWVISEAGKYSVKVNVETNTITFMLISKMYDAVAMVGPATPQGWAASKATPLAKNGHIFEWEGNLERGTLRFLCNPLAGTTDNEAWEVDQFIATEKDKEAVSGEKETMVLAAVKEADRGDYMWKINVPGTWRISLDNENMTVVFTLIQSKVGKCNDIAMVGMASPGDWELASIVNLTKTDGDWTWSGHLDTGDIQFLCDRASGGDWGAFRLVPLSENENVFPDSGTKGFDYMPSANDWKWNIAVAGMYEIFIDSDAQTVEFRLTESDASAAGYQDLGLTGIE